MNRNLCAYLLLHTLMCGGFAAICLAAGVGNPSLQLVFLVANAVIFLLAIASLVIAGEF